MTGNSALCGGLNAGEGNLVSGNSIVGIFTTSGSLDTAIRGNLIGTDPTGMSVLANGGGINHFNGTGTWRDITYNVISGNNGPGISIQADDRINPSADTIRIQRNRIGFNCTFASLLANSGEGIFFDSASITNVLIGGNAASEGNEISGRNDAIDLRAVGNNYNRRGSNQGWIKVPGQVTMTTACLPRADSDPIASDRLL